MTPEEMKEARKRLRITQKQLAKEIGKSTGQICHYERGITPIPKLVGEHVIRMLCDLKPKEGE